ncbi:hypothetical protein [Microbacterium sp. NPDC077184]|uniref:hypothetical protein n=1 Tax=Microbacterium sp. NPDC077184 TaxID=3154764 RepID=UPI0034261496
MSGFLHAAAVAAAALGVCFLACDRPRMRAPELAASVVMLVAMTDAGLTRYVPTVYWAAVLMACAMGIVLWRRPRRARRSRRHLPEQGSTAMLVHGAVGMVLMGALHLMMRGHHSDVGPAVTPHAHAVPLETAVGAAVVLYVVASLAWGVRMPRPLPRGEMGAMTLSVVLMSAGVLAV